MASTLTLEVSTPGTGAQKAANRKLLEAGPEPAISFSRTSRYLGGLLHFGANRPGPAAAGLGRVSPAGLAREESERSHP